MAPSSWRRDGIRSRSSSPRRRIDSPTSCRSATGGWPPRPSRSIEVRRRSWRSTCRRRRGATSSSRRAATPTCPTSACSHRPNERSCSTRTTSTRRCPDPGSGTSSGWRPASSSPPGATGSHRPRRAHRTLATVAAYRPRWPATLRCGCSTSGTTRRRDRHRERLIEKGKQLGNVPPRRPEARLEAIFAKARGKDQMKASGSLTAIVDGQWRIKDDPPVVAHIETPGGPAALERTFSDYRATLAENRRELVERYRFVDFALKVVGVGSVGTRCFVVLLEGRDEGDPLFLQAKEATESVLDPMWRAASTQPRGARRRRPAAHAGDARHLPGLDPGPGRAGLLLPPAVGHEGLGRHRDPAATGSGRSTAACAPGRWRARTPGAVIRSRSRRTSEPAIRSTERSRTSPRRTPTRTSAITRRSRRRSPPAGSPPSPARNSPRNGAVPVP